MFKNTTESICLKGKTTNFLLFSGLRNHQKIYKEPENYS